MELNFKTFGQGPPLVILHGLFGTLDNWQTLAKKLAKDYTVFIIDQRNHGKSPHLDAIDYPLMAEDLFQFLEANWIYEVNLIGHSMGGKTVMQFAVDHQDMINKLVVVDIGPQAYQGGHQTIFDALFALDLKKIESRKEADLILQERIPDFGVRQFLLKNLSRTPEGDYRWKMNLPVIYEHYQKILTNIPFEEPIETETLFIKGEKSDYLSQATWPNIQRYFPNGKMETIPNVGHWIHAEAPNEFLTLVSDFLK